MTGGWGLGLLVLVGMVLSCAGAAGAGLWLGVAINRWLDEGGPER